MAIRNIGNKGLIPILIKGSSKNIERNIFVAKPHFSTWIRIKNKYEGDFYLTSIIRALYSLPSLAGGRNLELKSLKIKGAEIKYYILNNGDVVIQALNIGQSIKPDAGSQSTGLYEVEYTEITRDWQTQDNRLTVMDTDHHWKGSHYAVVSGKFFSKEEAGKTLINHISNAYKAAIKKKDSHQYNNYYSLYWQNGQHHNPSNAASLASLIQQVQMKNADVNWLVHGEGAGTFVLALEELKRKQAVVGLMSKGNELREQNVFFSNPRGKKTSQDELKAICKEVGISCIGINLNTTDFKSKDAQNALLKESMVIGAGAFVFESVAAASGFGGVAKAWETVVDNPGSTTAGVFCLLAGMYVLGKSPVEKYSGFAKSVKSACSSTFGSGNQKWVE